MAGVAGPVLAEDVRRGARFLVGLLLGGVFATVLLSFALSVLGRLMAVVVDPGPRLVLLLVAMSGFGLADMADRTPHVWRQVPQRLAISAPPFARGIVWGFDLGLVFTTQKVTSLIWIVFVAVVAVAPEVAVVPMVAATVASSLAIMGSAAAGARNPSLRLAWSRRWQTWIRRTSGVVTLALVGLIASQLN